jgi:hypothetical protein
MASAAGGSIETISENGSVALNNEETWRGVKK